MKFKDLAYSLFWLCSLAFYNYYCLFASDSNHTGFPIRPLILFILLFFIFYGKSLIKGREPTQPIRWTQWLVLGLMGLWLSNVLFFDLFDVMLEYDDWIHRGMPDKPALLIPSPTAN